MQQLKHKSKRQEKIPVVMETLSVLVTLPSLWQALPLQRQVKWKTANSHSLPVSHYIWTLLSTLYLSSISHFLFAAPILGRQTSMSISWSPVLSKKPQHKLWEVVYSAQTAFSWGSGVPESLTNARNACKYLDAADHLLCSYACDTSISIYFLFHLCRKHFKEKY